MPIILSVESMTAEEKVLAMEMLWDSLCARPDGLVSPAWHAETLVQRERAIQQGFDAFEDWEQAKHALRRQAP